MKTILFSLILIGILACTEKSTREQEKVRVEETKEDLIVKTKGSYLEYYPGRKQLKISGEFDTDGNKHGIWRYYNTAGIETSMTTYEHGLREGFSVVKHPDGTLYYDGEYHADTMIGNWTFYDNKGKKSREVNYGLPK